MTQPGSLPKTILRGRWRLWVVVLCLLPAIWCLPLPRQGQPGEPGAQGSVPAAATPPIEGPEGSVGMPVGTPAPGDRPVPGVALPVDRDGFRASPAQRIIDRERWRTLQDPAAWVAELALRAGHGDADAALAIADVHEHCSMVMHPMVDERLAALTRLLMREAGYRAEELQALELQQVKLADACRTLVPAHQEGLARAAAQHAAWLQRAAALGHPRALWELADGEHRAQPDWWHSEPARTAMASLLAEGNPADLERYADTLARMTGYSAASFRLGACTLGLDCAGDVQTLLAACLGEPACGGLGRLRGELELSPRERQIAEAQWAELLPLEQAGDWATLLRRSAGGGG